MNVQSFAYVVVRLLALFWGVLGVWLLLPNLLETYREFNPSYWEHYFLSQLLRPLLALGLGCGLWIRARQLARCVVGQDES